MLRALGSASCDITHETRGTTCYGHCVLRLVISHTRDRGYDLLRALGSVSCDIRRYRGYDLLRALRSASCDITHETTATIYYGHWVLCLVITDTRQGVRIVTGIGFCVFRNHTRHRANDLLRALGSASCDITHETRGTICFGHWVLRLVISHTEKGVRFVTGIGFCIL